MFPRNFSKVDRRGARSRVGAESTRIHSVSRSPEALLNPNRNSPMYSLSNAWT